MLTSVERFTRAFFGGRRLDNGVLFSTTMKYRQLGQTSLTVSNLCYGTWQFGGDWGSFEVRVVAIMGARHPKQLTDTTAAADVELSDETLREIEMMMKDAVPTGGPSPEAM